MEDLTFGEQVKIILSRKKMTIKQLAELIEMQTGQKMSRQNLTQRLGRDNFQEQDMRMIAAILDCPFQLNIISGMEAPVELPIEIKKYRASKPVSPNVIELKIESEETSEKETSEKEAEEETAEEEMTEVEATEVETAEEERDMTVGEIYDINKDVKKRHIVTSDDPDFEPVLKREDYEEDREKGDINPYTGKEYQTNSVRVHPKRIGYVQVYDRSEHKWTDMTEWAFLGYQERKKVLLGKEYEPPIYLD